MPDLRRPRLADGTRLHGPYQGSGHVEPPCLIQRGDGSLVEVSRLLYLLAASVDGDRRAREVAAVVSTQLGRRMSASDVTYLIEHKLRPLGVLADSVAAPAAGSPPPVLGLTMRASVVPEAVVVRVTSWLRPLFRPGVVSTVLVLVGALDGWLLFGREQHPGLTEFAHRPMLLVLAMALTALAGLFHELGHATACRYAGARPGAIGVGLYLVWPVFYNDMTDCYRLNRAARLRADLGGIYFNAVFILALAGVYAATGFEPLLVVAGLHHLLIVQQLLPFVRLDGYYIVSDVAGVPDLFRYVRPVLARLVLRRPASSALQGLRPGPRRIVTIWVLVSVPLLVAAMVLLVLRLPHLTRVLFEVIALQSSGIVAGIRAQSTWSALASFLQLILVALPLIGLLGAVLHGVARAGRRRRDPTRPMAGG